MTALGLGAALSAGLEGQPLGWALGALGVVASFAGAMFLRNEWLQGAHRKLRDGASILWPVVTDVFHRMGGEESAVDRASLREIAEQAQEPISGEEDKQLWELVCRMYPRTESNFLTPQERERLEESRVLIRDAVSSLGRKIRFSRGFLGSG